MVIPGYIEQRTRQFYAWEKHGRGWYFSPEPVELEPVYTPFFFRYARPYVDDGRRPTVLSNIANWFRGTEMENPKQPEPFPEVDRSPIPFNDDSLLSCLIVLLPKGYVSKDAAMESLLAALSYTRLPVSFEIIATSEAITIQLLVRERDTGYVTGQVKAFIPGCVIHDATDDGERIAQNHGYIFCVDFGLREEFMRPLAIKIGGDSYSSLFAILDQLEGDERISLQILFTGLINDWSESIVDAVTTANGDSFFYDAPEMPSLAREKVSARLCAVTIRLITQADTTDEAIALAETACIPIIHTSESPYNALVPLPGEDYDFDLRIEDIVQRTSRRTGMLLNVRELATLLHFPSVSLSNKLQVDREHTNSAPESASGHDYMLGINVHHGVTKRISLSVPQRLKHIHIMGATGTGKSTLLLQLISQDITNGSGLAVLDPHGDLIETILHHIPENRINDVLIIDPADNEYPVSFNILTAHSDIEKEILASDLVSVFKRLSSSWGDQMNSVFANAILAFLESTEGGTLADLRRFLIEKSYRDSVLATVKDEHILYYWQKEYPLLKSSSVGSILTRLDGFLRPKVIRNMVVQKKGLDFEDLMDGKKIILVKLSHGLIGAENSYLLGSFIVSKIQQAAMARQTKAKELRSEFYLYIDEFQHFTTDSMSVILSGARKYGLGLILAHQSMQQLQKEDAGLASSVIANAGTRICFRLGEHDARLFGTSFASFTTDDLLRLDTGKAIARIERSDHDFSLVTLPIATISAPPEYIDRVIASSRKRYATPADEVKPSKPAETPESEIPKPPPTSTPKKQNHPLPTEEFEISEPVPEEKTDTIEQLVRHKQQSQHRYLQTLIKKLGEAKGYKATIEKPSPDGNGKIDVALERDGIVTACEISVTTDAEWEWHNLEKCLRAGCHHIIMVCTEKRTLEMLQKKVSSLDPKSKARITITSPDAFMASLQNESVETGTTEKVIKGYRVKVQYNESQDTEIQHKQSEIARIIGRKK